MSKINTLSSKTLIVTVDVSKGKHNGFLRTISDDSQKPFEFSNNQKGFSLFWNKIQKYKQMNNLEKILFASESTGSYGFPLQHFMKRKGAEVIQVNPMHVKRFKEVTDNSPNKTDNKDPRVIASLVLVGSYLQVNLPKGIIADLRNVIKYRESLNEDINRINNRLESLIVEYFPELLEIIKDFKTKTFLYLIEHYPTPSKIRDVGLERLTAELRKVSRGQFSEERSRELYHSAIHTIGVKEGIIGFEGQIKSYFEQLQLLTRQLTIKEAEIEEMLNKIEISRLMLTIKGLGPISVAGIISEVVDFNNFSIIPQIMKYAGLNLFEISSGRHRGQRKISKRGRSLLRKTLYFASLNLIRKGGAFHEDYQRLLSNGMKPKKALVAIARKLLRVLFAMIRDNKGFIKENKQENIKLAA